MGVHAWEESCSTCLMGAENGALKAQTTLQILVPLDTNHT
ncbi:hypothetical protein SynRS9902_02275 [Synechococcus sp. RS9902]|nr:hypothetical protein SynRS9902_02275 [Synechococcus sp. RS9902]